ncbi:hypothetical protein F5B21DRAFT_484649 [Xylaria acuta]|nr:hypothetical protein F5B21DRAFT_484649 [Xylaria acuta]
MSRNQASINWWPGCAPADLEERVSTMSAVLNYIKSNRALQQFSQILIRSGIHGSDSEAADHVTIWCKTEAQMESNQHQTAHILVRPKLYGTDDGDTNARLTIWNKTETRPEDDVQVYGPIRGEKYAGYLITRHDIWDDLHPDEWLQT